MCQTIVINGGEQTLGTVKDFKEYFHVPETLLTEFDDTVEDCCLCQVDIEKLLNAMNIPFKYDYGDYYIGKDLDKINL